MSRPGAWLDRLTAWSPAVLLAGLAALTFWLDSQIEIQRTRPDGSARHDPDVIMMRFRAQVFDARGHVREALVAERADHYPDDLSIEFAQPSLTVTEVNKPTVKVAADRGAVTGDQEIVTFRGNVRADQLPGAAAPGGSATGPLTLTSEFLRVLPRKGRMETDQAVTVEDPHGIIHAVGMDFDTHTRIVRMHKGIRGTFTPEQPAK